MSSSGLEVFDKTLQTTHGWLNQLTEDEAFGPNKQLAWHALGAVLRATRDQLPVDLAAHLGSQLPLLVRGTYYDQFRPSALPVRERSLEEFLGNIGDELEMTRPINLRHAARAVFRVLSQNVNRGQIDKVRESLPEDIRNIWPQPEEIGETPERRAAAR